MLGCYTNYFPELFVVQTCLVAKRHGTLCNKIVIAVNGLCESSCCRQESAERSRSNPHPIGAILVSCHLGPSKSQAVYQQ